MFCLSHSPETLPSSLYFSEPHQPRQQMASLQVPAHGDLPHPPAESLDLQEASSGREKIWASFSRLPSHTPARYWGQDPQYLLSWNMMWGFSSGIYRQSFSEAPFSPGKDLYFPSDFPEQSFCNLKQGTNCYSTFLPTHFTDGKTETPRDD